MNNLQLIGPIDRDPCPAFSQDVADKICERLSEGESLRSICRDEGMPTLSMVLRWRTNDAGPGFAAQYARARENQADVFADDVTDIADNPDLAPEDKRVMIDARKWRAGRQKPKSWGDKVKHEHELVTDDSMDAAALPGGLAFLAQHKSEGDEG